MTEAIPRENVTEPTAPMSEPAYSITSPSTPLPSSPVKSRPLPVATLPPIVPTTSIPRLGARIGLVQLSDGKFGVNGSMEGYAPPGQGEIEIPRLIQLLKGIGFGGYLVVHWPKLWVPSLADADAVLPAAAQYIRPLIDETPIVLTAYKGDKNAPKYATAADPS